ncbi:MAG: hypothetical protein HS107_05825 [Thermoflexaceae bacterium]|nr:hypothetical protein [Thermoflexaceae bacterium]
MSGIFYDPGARCLRRVYGTPEPGWTFVTHNLGASVHHCRRIMREWVPTEEIFAIDWSGIEPGGGLRSA